MAEDGVNLEQYLHGYVRLVYYNHDAQNKKNPSYPWYIWEGGISGGYSRFSHFGRFIDAW